MLYQVAYQNPEGHALHQTTNAREALVLFKNLFDAFMNGGEWLPLSIHQPQTDEYEERIITEGDILPTRDKKDACLIHLHIIKK